MYALNKLVRLFSGGIHRNGDVRRPQRQQKRSQSPVLVVEKGAASIATLAGRPPYSAEWLDKHQILGMHCGCGTILHRGWLNTDRLLLKAEDGGHSDSDLIVSCKGILYLQHDARNFFPLATGSLTRVFAEHFLEHLQPAAAIKWLREMRRLLRPKGILRISTPDLAKYVAGYFDPKNAFFEEHRLRLETLNLVDVPTRRAWMLNQIFLRWGHQWIYDCDEIVLAAKSAGFSAKDVRIVDFRCGADQVMANLDMSVRNDESLYVEIVNS